MFMIQTELARQEKRHAKKHNGISKHQLQKSIKLNKEAGVRQIRREHNLMFLLIFDFSRNIVICYNRLRVGLKPT